MVRSVIAVALLLAILPASASLIEDETGGIIHYQFDAGTGHDAPDTCQALLGATLSFRVAVDGEAGGLLAPPDDAIDHFFAGVATADVGDRVMVEVIPGDVSVELDVEVLTPNCGTSVMAPENQPAQPHNPPAPGPGQKHATLHNGAGTWTCDPTRWFFVLNQMGGTQAPATIHVTWTNGQSENVPLLQATPATTAHYQTANNLGYTVKQATAVVPATWTGKLNIGAGPCNAQDGQASFGPPNQDFGAVVEYTPLVSGDYIVVVTMKTPEVPSNVPVTCHGHCVPGGALESGVQPLAYNVLYSK